MATGLIQLILILNIDIFGSLKIIKLRGIGLLREHHEKKYTRENNQIQRTILV